MPLKFRAAFLFIFALTLFAQSGFTQEGTDDPILARMKKDIYFLASDECEGRGLGTLGLDLAAHYIAAQFKKAGLQPGGVSGTYFQPFNYATGATADGESTCFITGPKGERIELKQGKDFQVVGTSGPGKVDAPLVFAGYGVTANKIAYDDFAGIDAKGKAIITLRRLPRYADKEKPFDGASKDELNALASLDSKQFRGEARQAAAVILVNDASELPNDGLVAFAVSKALSTVSTPFVQIKRAIIEDIMTKSTGTSLADTEKAIDGELKPRSAALTGWNIQLNVRIKRTEIPVKNVIGVVEGKGPLANEIVVVGAHYDHLGYGGPGSLSPKEKGKIHYGADDNGSGSTSVMELARRFAAKKDREGRKIIFMTFTAEERGLIGSRHYTRAPLHPLKDTVAMFNLDMVGRVKEAKDGAKPKLLVLGIDSGKGFGDLVNKYNNGFDVVNDRSVFGASDHYSFYQQKIPVLFFFTGIHPEYHRPTDVADKINVRGMKQVADYAESIIAHWAADPKRPEYTAMAMGGFKGGGPKGPRLGILPDYTFGGKGVLVEAVVANGPAAEAGMKKGDIIIAIAGKMIGNVDGYTTLLAQQKSGVAIEVRVLRDNREVELKVTPK